MDLVYEKDRGQAGPEQGSALCRFENLANFFDSGADGREGVEFTAESLRNYPREGGFTHSGRAPEYEGREVSALYHIAQDTAFTDQVLLADIFFETPWSHALRQGSEEGCCGHNSV